MTFFNVNCCFQFYSFICGSKTNLRKSLNKRDELSSSKFFQKDRSEQITFNDNQLKFPEKRILYRNDRNERFGLTLSYEYQWKKQLKIYIEKIDENSLADLDGHFQVGDEIIRINNRSFSNRDHAIELISQHSFLILEIIPSKFVNRRSSRIESIRTEDDSGILLETQNEKRSLSFPNLIVKEMNFIQMKNRRCLSCNDLSKISFLSNQFQMWKRSISSESFFTISTNNPQGILKPLPFDRFTAKQRFRPKYRQDSLNDQMVLPVYKAKCSVKKGKRKRSFQTIEEDFYLLNRIFLRENQNELVKKPFLAMKYQQQSNIQKQLLKDCFQKSSFNHSLTSNSTTNLSAHTSTIHSPNIFI